MNNLPKFLGFSFKNPELKREILKELNELIIGEEPTEFLEELDGVQREVFLISEENTTNKALYELLVKNEADIFTCRFDLTQEEAEFEEVTPFVYKEAQAAEPSSGIKVANDDVLSKLDFALETDIFKFVDDSQSNELFGEFEKEQSAINLEYSRLGKDILEYRNSNLIELAKKVSNSLTENEIFQKLEKSKQGLENLKYNQEEELEELDYDFEVEKKELSERLVIATLDNDQKAKAIIEHELQERNKLYQKQRNELIEKNEDFYNRNQEVVEDLKKELEHSIIDIADTLVNFDLKRLYKYEQRYNQTRDLVREYFSVDRTKEIEQQELRAKKLSESVSLSESSRISESLSTSESLSLSSLQSSIASESESILNSQELSDKDYLEELIKGPSQIEQVTERSETIEEEQDIISKDYLRNMISSPSLDEQEEQRTVEAIKAESEDYYLSEQLAAKLGGGVKFQKNTDTEVMTEAITEESSESVEEVIVEDLTVNDTIQFKDSEPGQTQEENLESHKKSTVLSKNRVLSSLNKQKLIWVSSVAGVVIIGAIGLSLLSGGNRNQNTHLAQSKTTSTISKEEKENFSGVTSKSKGSKQDTTLSNKEYQENVEVLVSANIGMYLDDNDELTGTMKVRKEDGTTALRYIIEYKRNGTLIVKDKEGAVSTYDKKWVDSLIQTLSERSEKQED